MMPVVDLRLSIDLPRERRLRSRWHEAEFQMRRVTVPVLTLSLSVRLSPLRVIASARRPQRSFLEAAPSREWTWPPRRAAA